MSPAKQKLIEKHTARDRKASSRQAPASGGTAASAYNPASGTFHTLESVSSDTGTCNHNGRFRSIDDVDDSSCSNGAGAEYDCMSNNGSCSEESEDQLHVNGKEKHGVGKLGAPPGLVGGMDKRDKIRWKNERKHQRQKERRAQELRDKCTGYLMSRKLEALAQQLVGMGFSSERATMALIFNEGHVEQSVAWLLEGGEGQVQEDWNTGGNLKIDISEELRNIAEIENKYKYTRPEIERAVVSCEGDLGKALECLRVRNRNTSPVRAEGHKFSGGLKDAPGHAKEHPPLSAPSMSRISGVAPTKASSIFQATYQPRREDRDSTYSKGRLQASPPGIPQAPPEGVVKGAPYSRNLSYAVTDWQRSSSPADRRGCTHGARPPSYTQTASQSCVAPNLFASDSRADIGLPLCSGGIEAKMVRSSVRESFVNLSSKESVVSTQSPKFPCTTSQPTAGINICPVSTSPMFSPSSWTGGFTEAVSPSSVLYVNSTSGDAVLKGANASKKSVENLNKGGADLQGQYHLLGSTQSDSAAAHWTLGGNGLLNSDVLVPSSSHMNSARHAKSSLGTSYGLYTGWGSGLSRSSVDWSMGTMANCDYKNIDWSMGASPSSSTEVGRMWGLSSNLTSLKLSEGWNSGQNLEEERGFQAISGSTSLVTESNNGLGVWKATSPALGVQDKPRGEQGNTTALGVHEWTSPFAGKDLFTLPQQAVPSPSL